MLILETNSLIITLTKCSLLAQESSITAERAQEKTSDPICGLTASDKTLIIARESGTIHR